MCLNDIMNNRPTFLAPFDMCGCGLFNRLQFWDYSYK